MRPKSITTIASTIGILREELELHTDYRAKIKLSILEKIKNKKSGKYIIITGINPTPLGEGKTTTALGLSAALNKVGKTSICCLRQPSLGPLFGIKGPSGGGSITVIPNDDFNLFSNNDDMFAISVTHNLCSSFLFNAIYRNQIKISEILWKYAYDLSDRFLRKITIGEDIKYHRYFPLKTGFISTAASEIMAIVSLSNSFKELKEKISSIVLGFDYNGRPITTKHIKVAGAMNVLLKNVLKPNLMQTNQHTPVFIHTGPYANISHGNSSIISDKIALKLSEYTITESGFGTDCGFEKFINIKCRYSNEFPDCAVLVSSIKAIKLHSGKINITSNNLPDEIYKENIKLLEEGLPNLNKHIENIKIFGIPIVVVINRFNTDTDNEVKFLEKKAKEFGADYVVISEIWQKGVKGAYSLVEAVIKASNRPKKPKFLYSLESSIEEKIYTIATKIYGAKDIKIFTKAKNKLAILKKNGFDKLPVCIAKTQFSLSHNPSLKGAPKNFVLPISDIIPHIGAGYITAITTNINILPALPSLPIGTKFDIDDYGKILNL